MSKKAPVSRLLKQKLQELNVKSQPEEAEFKQKYHKELGYMSIPHYAPKHAKEIALSRPWTGEESVADGSLRMLVDKSKPLKVSRKQRLSNARENSLDYKYNTAKGETFKERLNKPRGLSSGMSGGNVESIANQQIEDAISRGQFTNLERGKSIDLTQYKQSNPYIDTTEFILNRMIQKQGAAPPWILKQRAMYDQIENFRKISSKKLLDTLVHWYVDTSPGESVNDILDNVQRTDPASQPVVEEWKQRDMEYFRVSVDMLNSVIRGYNLQAPSAARKGYLNVPEEINTCIESVKPQLIDAIKVYKGYKSVMAHKKDELHRSDPPLESPDKHYGLRHMIRDLFRREKQHE